MHSRKKHSTFLETINNFVKSKNKNNQQYTVRQPFKMSCTSQTQESNQKIEAYTAVPFGEQQVEHEEIEEEISWSTCGENCLLAILPCLLFIQFGVAYLSDTPPHLHWVIVNLGILCFIFSSLVFRRAFSDPESLVALVPEVLIDVILGLILFEKTELAAIIMFSSTLGMGFVSIFKLAFTESTEDEEENDLKQPLV